MLPLALTYDPFIVLFAQIPCLCSRSVREALSRDEWEAPEEEEDDREEVYAQPVLQRILLLRGPVRADSGITAEPVS